MCVKIDTVCVNIAVLYSAYVNTVHADNMKLDSFVHNRFLNRISNCIICIRLFFQRKNLGMKVVVMCHL